MVQFKTICNFMMEDNGMVNSFQSASYKKATEKIIGDIQIKFIRMPLIRQHLWKCDKC